MQIRLRCFSCSTPIILKQEEVDAALTQMHEADHKYYNALCPKCGKANKISKKQLVKASPKWEPPQ